MKVLRKRIIVAEKSPLAPLCQKGVGDRVWL